MKRTAEEYFDEVLKLADELAVEQEHTHALSEALNDIYNHFVRDPELNPYSEENKIGAKSQFCFRCDEFTKTGVHADYCKLEPARQALLK